MSTGVSGTEFFDTMIKNHIFVYDSFATLTFAQRTCKGNTNILRTVKVQTSVPRMSHSLTSLLATSHLSNPRP